MLSGGMKLVKYLLFIFNLIIVLVGLALIVIGALALIHADKYMASINTGISAAAIFILVIGVIIFIIAFFGCCGSVQESYCMIVTFAVFLSIILILEIAAAVTAFVFPKKLSGTLRDQMKDMVTQYNDPKHKGANDSWNFIQKELHCCGADNYTDWRVNKFLPNGSVPDSCCRNISTGCGTQVLDNPHAKDVVYTEGCVNKFQDVILKIIGIIGGVAAGFALIEIIGIVLASCLASAVHREYDVV